MSAILLRQQGVASFTPPKSLEALFTCANGILLRAPMDAFRGLHGVAPQNKHNTRELVRELIAFRHAKKK